MGWVGSRGIDAFLLLLLAAESSRGGAPTGWAVGSGPSPPPRTQEIVRVGAGGELELRHLCKRRGAHPPNLGLRGGSEVGLGGRFVPDERVSSYRREAAGFSEQHDEFWAHQVGEQHGNFAAADEGWEIHHEGHRGEGDPAGNGVTLHPSWGHGTPHETTLRDVVNKSGVGEGERRQLPVKLDDRGDKQWSQKLGELKAFKDANGHCNLPYKGEFGALGRWVTTQRTFFHKGLMPEDRIEQLEGIGFDWDFHSRLWEAHLFELLLFRTRHGHCQVPYRYKVVTGGGGGNPAGGAARKGPSIAPNADEAPFGKVDLGSWVNNQRSLCRTGKIGEERLARLRQAGFVFEVADEVWMGMLQNVCIFRQVFGHAHVPRKALGDLGFDHRTLVVWLALQRSTYVKRKMPTERVRRLEGLGFAWKSPKRPDWEVMLQEVLAFRDKGADVDARDSGRARVLRWLTRQSQLAVQGRLGDKRAKRLVAVGLMDEGTGRVCVSDPQPDGKRRGGRPPKHKGGVPTQRTPSGRHVSPSGRHVSPSGRLRGDAGCGVDPG